MKSIILTALVVSTVMMGCERKPADILAPQPQNPNGNVDPFKPDGNNGSANETIDNIGIYLAQEKFEKFSVDINNLSYKFTYLSVTASDRITFVDKKAKITISNLPANKSGDLVFEILEGSTAKFRSVLKNLSLKPGQQTIQLNPEYIGGGGVTPPGETSELILDIIIEDPGTNPVTPVPTVVVPTVVPTPQPTNIPTVIVDPTPVPTNVPTTVVPVLDWDGKSFKGNDKWNIVPVQ
jgi:hypothetical protein